MLVRPDHLTEFKMNKEIIEKKEIPYWKSVLIKISGFVLNLLKKIDFNEYIGFIKYKSSLYPGNNVMLIGNTISQNNKLIFIPRLISDDIKSIEKSYLHSLKMNLVITFFFVIGALFSYYKINLLKNKKFGKNTIKIPSGFKCKICNTKEPDVIVKPCNDLCICGKCVKETEHCPVCKVAIEGSLRIFYG